MGDLGDVFTFDSYISALERADALDSAGTHLAQMAVLGSLAAGALILFGVMLIRRSGTAAAGFALVVLTALSQAMMFGVLDFLTPSTGILIGTLTASALLLFVNAVLHTGRENILIAGFSAIVIAALLGLGGASMAGLDFAGEARLAMLGAALVSSALLIFAMARDFRGKVFLGASVLLSVLASMLMTDPIVPLMRDLAPVTLPSMLIVCGVLLATLSAPFLADEMRMPSRRERMAAPGYAPTSLFADPPETRAARRGKTEQSVFSRQPTPRSAASLFPEDAADGFAEAATAQPPRQPDAPFAAATFASGAGDTVSNHWRQDANAVLQAEPDEYVWDALAQPEVRCGDLVLHAFGAQDPNELGLEGLRERLAPQCLDVFDVEVLGGADPASGMFDVPLQTSMVSFVLRGRRKVDHDGILMRVDADISNVAPVAAPVGQLAGPAVALPAGLGVVVNLADRSVAGLEVAADAPDSEDSWKDAILASAGLVKRMIDSGARGAFALIDASAADIRPGVIAAALGKAVRVHELPRGAMVVGLSFPQKNEQRAFTSRADDIRKAGGGVALFLDGPNSRPLKGFEPDMVWLSAFDLPLGKGSRRPLLESVQRHFSVPIVLRDLRDDSGVRAAQGSGAGFGVGGAFADIALPTLAPLPAAAAEPPRMDHPGGHLSALRAKGLR